MTTMKTLILAAAVIMMAACGGPQEQKQPPPVDAGQDAGQPPPVDAGQPDAGPQNTVTSVTITGPSSIPFYGTANLTAVVQGVGTYLPFVNWILNEGGGSLSATTGANVVYTAPFVVTSTTAIIYAISQVDSTVFGSITITVIPPPTVEAFFVGGAIVGTETFTRYDGYAASTPDKLTLTSTDGGLIVSDDTAHVFDGYSVDVPGGDVPALVLEFNNDGTLTIPYACGPSLPNPVCAPNCSIQVCNGSDGAGTWDFHGNIAFNFSYWVNYSGQSTKYGVFSFTGQLQ